MKTRRIPFDIEKAKAGAKVVTRDGYPIRIGFFDLKGQRSFPIVGAIDRDGIEEVRFFTADGKFSSIFEEDGYDLFIEEEVKTRRMTYSELAKWLRECPNEFRELKNEHNGVILSTMSYREIEADEPVPERLLIRRDYCEWQEPLIEI